MEQEFQALLKKINRDELVELLYYEYLHHPQQSVGNDAPRILELYHSRKHHKTPKEDIEKVALNMYQRNPKVMYHLIELFPYKVALGTFEVEQLLGISKFERMRWTKDGRLPLLEVIQKVRFGKKYEFPVYHYLIREMIPEWQIGEWRRMYEEEKHEHFVQGALRGVETKRREQEKREQSESLILM